MTAIYNWLLIPTNGIPAALSVWTLVCMWLAGHDPRSGWAMALAGQTLWFGYTFAADAWGFLPLNIGLTIVYARNLMRARVPTVAARPDKAWYAEQMLKTTSGERDSLRLALQELVTLKDLKSTDLPEYERRKPAAWESARYALSQNWEAMAGAALGTPERLLDTSRHDRTWETDRPPPEPGVYRVCRPTEDRDKGPYYSEYDGTDWGWIATTKERAIDGVISCPGVRYPADHFYWVYTS